MSSNPNYTPHHSTQCTDFSSNVGASAFNVPPFTNIRPPNLNNRPPLSTPPLPPLKLQQFQLQSPSLNQQNAQSATRHPLPHLPPPNLPPSCLPPPQLPPSRLPLSRFLPTHHPPPHHQSSQPPPPRHPPPTQHPLCPPQLRPPPPPGFIPNWAQMGQKSIPATFHAYTLEKQQQISTISDFENDQNMHQYDQIFASRNNGVQYNKLSVEDRIWLKGFEEVIVSVERRVPLVEKPLRENKLKLSEVTSLASESRTLLKTLKELKAEMEKNASTASDENWHRFVGQVEQTKEILNINIVQLQNPQITKVIQSRRLKRKRLKANKKKLLEEKCNKICEWKQKEVDIDIWREQIIKKEKDELREKQIKAEADSVLSEIRLKENEASRMIQLVDALKQLRRTRTNKGDKFGYVTNSVSDNRFDTVLGKLQGLVSSQLSDYKMEEATLRVMMEESGSKQSVLLSGRHDKDTAMNSTCSSEVKIDNLLFGHNSHKTTPGKLHLQSLVERRHEWDEFLTPKENPLGSSVPLGWVVPPSNPSEQWDKFLAT